MNTGLLVTPSSGFSSAVSPELSAVSPVMSTLASWQGFLAPVGTLGVSGLTVTTELAMAESLCAGYVTSDARHAVAGVVATAVAPFAMAIVASTLPVNTTAVAGAQQVATAPKQAEKPNDTRNDAHPRGIRPGAPPS